MSKYNSYIKRGTQVARNTFNDYRQAEAAYQKARENAAKYPQRMGWVDADYASKSAHAIADLRDAEAGIKRAKNRFAAGNDALKKIRGELVAELDADYAVDPKNLDPATLELLKSGIMQPDEYSRLMDEAVESGNSTMARIISKYASERADELEKRNGNRHPNVMELRHVSYRSSDTGKDEKLAVFDAVSDFFRRCEENPAMIDRFDEFTEDLVENF